MPVCVGVVKTDQPQASADAVPPATSVPMACGVPISEATADAAAHWLTVLMSGEASAQEHAQWQDWRAAHPEHELAWQHVQAVTGRWKALAPQAAYQALSPYAERSQPPSQRRRALRVLVGAGVACLTGALVQRTPLWREHMAHYRTGTGQQRTVVLDDGTRLVLNTATAVRLAFDGQQRRVHLVAGEVLVETGHPAAGQQPDARPFWVETPQCHLRALGTRFSVRLLDGITRVAVLQSAVQALPAGAATQGLVLQAGWGADVHHSTVGDVAVNALQEPAWVRGQLVADDMRLADFAHELARYRSGWLQCDASVADLRISGVFPLADTDRILDTLPMVLPVQVRMRTRFWATLEAVQ